MSGGVGEQAAVGPAIEALGIINRFGSQTVHDGLDMSVVPGEVFGIVGGSGSGKSGKAGGAVASRIPHRGTPMCCPLDHSRKRSRDQLTFRAAHL